MLRTISLLEPYKIIARFDFQSPAGDGFERQLEKFAGDVDVFLTYYDQGCTTIHNDPHLSQDGQTAKVTAFREKCKPDMAGLDKRVGNLITEYNTIYGGVFAPIVFAGSGNAAADESRAVEIRGILREMSPVEILRIYYDKDTSQEVISAIERSPIPLITVDMLDRGKVAQVERLRGAELEALRDRKVFVECCRDMVLGAHRYTGIDASDSIFDIDLQVA